MTKLEYIWIDGTEDVPQLRSKTKVVEEFDGTVNGPSGCPVWSFDGSSTNQAPGDNSDCVLKPVRLYESPLEKNCYLVLCGVWNTDDTPHETNVRWKLHKLLEGKNNEEPWFGFEQEYTLYKEGRPVGWPADGSEPPPQGDYYCGRNAGEQIARTHMDACILIGIGISGINSEVMLGQWEYQIFGNDALKATDDMWISRWLMEKIAGSYDIDVNLDPKPVKGNWNGAGCHTNFSTKYMRDKGGDEFIFKACMQLDKVHREHMKVYGSGNERRLTGKHETQTIDTFNWGVSDRGASIRIPWQVDKEGKGYLEDRRPSANCDPYLVAWRLIKTICEEK